MEEFSGADGGLSSALPPYAPELNPVERVWLYLKERFLSHRLHADYEAIARAASKAWNRLIAEAGRLKSLVTYSLDQESHWIGWTVSDHPWWAECWV